MNEPAWLERARDFVGLTEIAGAMHEPKILQLWRDAKMPYVHDDETAWCAAFACAMLERSMISSPRMPNARSFTAWGLDVLESGAGMVPLGSIVVFSRPPNPAQGHVGFAVGFDPHANCVMTLGGNQGNRVSIAAVRADRLIAARWPTEDRTDLLLIRRVPAMSNSQPVSTNEA
jgi:uncharacterized protein (TIGR02594 family)